MEAEMKKNKIDAGETFRTNVLYMMSHIGLDYEDVGRMIDPGITPVYFRQLLDEKKKSRKYISPTVEKVEALAKIFKLKPWQLMLPDLPEQVVRAVELGELIENYLAASPEGQTNIELTAKLAPRAVGQP